MATPAEIGISANAPTTSTPNTTSSFANRMKPVRQASANSSAAEANHLSCSRSTPWARRKRRASEVTPSTIESSAAAPASADTTSSTGPAPATPTGLIVPSTAASAIGPGRSAGASAKPAIAATVSHRTGRQRRPGRRPSGNSRNSSAGTPNSAGSCTQLLSHAATSPPGSDPGAVTSAYVA